MLNNAKIEIGKNLCGYLPKKTSESEVEIRIPCQSGTIGDSVRITSNTTMLIFSEIEVYETHDNF